MIKEFHIENFKGFEHLSIPNLARINLIGGKNNVGKTSLLESIFTFYDRYNTDLLIKQLSWRGGLWVVFKEESLLELWLSAFHNFNLKEKIRLTLIDSKSGNETVEIGIDENFVVPIASSELSNYSGGSNSSTTQQRSKYALYIKAEIKKRQQQNCHIYFLNGNIQMFAKFMDTSNRKSVTFLSSKTHNPILESVRFGELMKKGKESEVVEILKIVEPRLKSINPIPVSENQTVLYADIGLPTKIPLNYLGDGISRVLSYISAILSNPGGIVLIDEIENGLHYSIHEEVWKIIFKAASKDRVQLFVNTHSLEMVKSFNKVALEVDPSGFMYYELFENMIDNKIDINSIDNEILAYKIENNKNFRGE